MPDPSNKEIAKRLRGLDDVSPDLCRLAAERLEKLERELAEQRRRRGILIGERDRFDKQADELADDAIKAEACALTNSDRQRLREIANKLGSGHWVHSGQINFLRDLASRGEGE